MEKVNIETFLALAKKHVVLDVRSPGEYGQACIPGACNLPLFTDEERKIVGTAYKQQGRQEAIKIGLDFFGVKMKKMVEEVEEITRVAVTSEAERRNSPPGHYTDAGKMLSGLLADRQVSKDKGQITVLVHCWRGGMRSAGVAWLLGLYGFKVYTLAGGYKAFRNWVLKQFEVGYPFRVLGGYTGSGKTQVLHALAQRGKCVIDLERLAHHKGSAFGALGEEKQPRPEMFENKLAIALHDVYTSMPSDAHIWIEDESRRIGDINLPGALWDTMRRAPLYFLEIPFEVRLDFIVKQYGVFEKERLLNSIMRIQKRLGNKNANDAARYLEEGNLQECFRILLHYYDKFYAKDLDHRGKLFLLPQTNNKFVQSASKAVWNISMLRKQPGALFLPVLTMKKVACDAVDAEANSRKLES